MLLHVCSECLPASKLDSFDGPEDERECICCGRAMVCRMVDPADAVRAAALAPDLKAGPSAPTAPAAPPSPPKAPPAAPPLPPLPAPAGSQVSQ